MILPNEGVAPSELTADELADATRELGASAPDAGTVVMPSFDVSARIDLLEGLPGLDLDHLDGILYPMRIRDFRHFGFTDLLFPGLDSADD